MPLFDLASARERRQLALAAHPASEPRGIPPRKRLRYEEMIEFVERLVADGNLAATGCRRRPSSRRRRASA
jgi:hypothetical protein